MPELSLNNLSRRYGAVQALDAVSLTVASGEVHALMGENGAGKSTLIRLLAGLEPPDAGTIKLDGQALPEQSPAAVRAAGLRFIHQELHAVHGLSVAENMHLDHPYPTRAGLVNWRALNRAASQALAQLGLDHIDPRSPMSTLGHGDQMLVRIAATLIASDGLQAWLYVMDEPTAALTTQEVERLFAVIDDLVGQGAGILYVSHRMPEVMQLAQSVSVLRDGQHISSGPLAETSERQIIEEMTGRDLSHLFPPKRDVANTDEPVLEVSNLAAGPVRSADFTLRPGDILGVAGLAGSGRGALLRALMGELPLLSGEVKLGGVPLGATTADIWADGLAYIPRERRSEGLMLGRSISENIALPHLSVLARLRYFLDHRRQRTLADRLGQEVLVKATSMAQSCEELSGGNQQKVLFARALAGEPRVLLLDEPTRGVDIGAKFELYRLISDLSQKGLAVIIASSDLPELLGLADQVAIMRDGEMAETMPTDGLTEADLLSHFYHLTDGQAVA